MPKDGWVPLLKKEFEGRLVAEIQEEIEPHTERLERIRAGARKRLVTPLAPETSTLQAADREMQRAKRAGKDRVPVAGDRWGT